MVPESIQSQRSRGRFAPSTTGRAHPGTLLSALLCWLDARSRGDEVWLRLEDLDPARCRPEWADAMRADLEWFGLDWDGELRQGESHAPYEDVLAELVEAGRVYACVCTRGTLRAAEAERAPDGSLRYPGTCRDRIVARGDWRRTTEALRVRLDPGVLFVDDESAAVRGGDPSLAFGDPLIRRRDGAYSYHFASVVDDERMGVGRIVRGRDLAPSTLVQAALRDRLGWPAPVYRHHALLLERSGEKLSKFHGAVDVEALRTELDAPALCGALAAIAGLVPRGRRCRPRELVADFEWTRVFDEDVEVRFVAGAGASAIRPG